MPKLTARTAILKVVDSKTFRDGALVREVLEKCKSWGISREECECEIQDLEEKYELSEEPIGYLRRMEKNKYQ